MCKGLGVYMLGWIYRWRRFALNHSVRYCRAQLPGSCCCSIEFYPAWADRRKCLRVCVCVSVYGGFVATRGGWRGRGKLGYRSASNPRRPRTSKRKIILFETEKAQLFRKLSSSQRIEGLEPDFSKAKSSRRLFRLLYSR